MVVFDGEPRRSPVVGIGVCSPESGEQAGRPRRATFSLPSPGHRIRSSQNKILLVNPRFTGYGDAVNQKLSELDPGDKSTDIGDERGRRHEALLALQAALENEDRVEREAAERTAAAASTAVWLGASLADLAAVTGRTRQAARKRWPVLGDIHRRRLWLGNHVDDIKWAAAGVLASEAEIDLPDGSAFDELRRLSALLEAEFDESAGPGEYGPAQRWHELSRLLDKVLRGIVDAAVPTTGQAEFAVFGAKGVIGYWDHASNKPDADAGLA